MAETSSQFPGDIIPIIQKPVNVTIVEDLQQNVPEKLKTLNRWIVWRFEFNPNETKPRKVPYSAQYGTPSSAGKEHEDTWTSFEIALNTFSTQPFDKKFDGIGFVFTNTEYTGIDIDDAFNPEYLERTSKIVLVCSSYTEISPSGTGLHIIIEGKKRGKACRKGKLEVYDDGRFFTFTGKVYENNDKISQNQGAIDNVYENLIDRKQIENTSDTATEIIRGKESYSDEFVIDKMTNSTSERGLIIKDLFFAGNWQKYKKNEFPSQSEADISLCRYFAFYKAPFNQIERLFNKSKLVRDKWTSRPEYREITIKNAITSTSKYYDPGYRCDDLTDEHKGYHLTEGGAGYRFADERGDDVLFCKTMNKWFIFDGSRFRIDTKNKIHTFVKQMVKKMWGELGEITDRRKRDIVFKYVKSLDNCAKVDNIVKFVSSEEKIAVDPEELDNDSTKIILMNGAYDLNLSTLLPFSKEYKITKQTKSEYIENAKCEKWLQHLSLIFNNDKELIECFQIAIGFTFIEGNPDQVIFLAFGSGENGKSVTLDTLAKVLGDYAKITNFETFSIKSNTDPHSDIAALKAVRLCIAAEAKDDTKNKFNLKLLDTELIKKLSGGEPLKCRFLYGEWFDLFAEFKLWLMLNELPTITDNSHAMWRRLILFPFNVTIPPKQKMLDFDKILYREERAGILSWVLEGYKKYKTLGKLKTCAAMEIAKEDYHLEQDNILRFAKDVLFGHLESIKKKECYDAYKKWCSHEEVSAKGKQAFFKEIIKLNGVKEVKIMGEMKFQIKYNTQKELLKDGCIF